MTEDWKQFTTAKGKSAMSMVVRTELKVVILPGDNGKPTQWGVQERGNKEMVAKGRADTVDAAESAAMQAIKGLQPFVWNVWYVEPPQDEWRFYGARFFKATQGFLLETVYYGGGNRKSWRWRVMLDGRVVKLGALPTSREAQKAAESAMADFLETGEEDLDEWREWRARWMDPSVVGAESERDLDPFTRSKALVRAIPPEDKAAAISAGWVQKAYGNDAKWRRQYENRMAGHVTMGKTGWHWLLEVHGKTVVTSRTITFAEAVTAVDAEAAAGPDGVIAKQAELNAAKAKA